MLRVPWKRIRARLRPVIWPAPAACVFAAMALGSALVAVDHKLPSLHGDYLYQGPPSGARWLLDSIINSMISLTGVVFSAASWHCNWPAASSRPGSCTCTCATG